MDWLVWGEWFGDFELKKRPLGSLLGGESLLYTHLFLLVNYVINN